VTVQIPHTDGGPAYPVSTSTPPEFFRKQPDGDEDNTQTITIQTANGLEKRPVKRGWNKTVTFASDTGDQGD
jgi:hypothetical protein